MNIKKICEEYYPIVLGYLLTLTNGNKDLAEDLTQETFYRAIKNIDGFRGECRVSTWLCQIAKYTFWQQLEKTKKYKHYLIGMAIGAGIPIAALLIFIIWTIVITINS